MPFLPNLNLNFSARVDKIIVDHLNDIHELVSNARVGGNTSMAYAYGVARKDVLCEALAEVEVMSDDLRALLYLIIVGMGAGSKE